MAAGSLLAALSATILTASPSFAALPGEEDGYHAQNLPVADGSGSFQQTARGANEEDRNGGALVHAWHSDDDQNNLWANVSFDNSNGVPVRINLPPEAHGIRGNPAVAGWGASSFQIFFTGMNDRIYRATYAPTSTDAHYNNLQTLTWVWTGDTSRYAPAAVQIGAGQRRVSLAFVGLTNPQIYTEQFAAQGTGSGRFVNRVSLGGQAVAAPSITYANIRNGVPVIAIFHTGTTARAYGNAAVADQPDQWGVWASVDGEIVGQPAAVATPSGTIVMGSRAPSGDVWFQTMTVNTQATPTFVPRGWVQDSAHWNSAWDVGLSINDTGDVYANVTGNDSNHVYYKRVFRDGS